MKKICALILLLLPLALWAQNVSNVTVKQVGDKIEISYDMDAPLRNQYNRVNVYCSTDGGATFANRLEQVSGDVFDKARQGHNTVIWDVSAEKDKLIGDNIVFEVRIDVLEHIDFTVNGVNFKMMYVEGGTFTMGATAEQGKDASKSEKPAHPVTLTNGYFIGETEVAQELWTAVMGSNPSYIKGDNLPVEQVSWNDVQAFIGKLNRLTGKKFRLPTEAEWEYAARGGNKSKGYKYSGSNTLGNVAWYYDNSGKRTHPVGTKQPNELGIYDMSGSVYEWCSDWYGGYSSGAQTNPQGPSSGSSRVLRGGCWNDFSRSCRVSNRLNFDPDGRGSGSGFRLVLVP